MRVVTVVLLLAVSAYVVESSLHIAAWNIQVFGKTKMSKPDVVEVIVDVCLLYDIIAIQEVRDIDEIAVWELLDEINAKSNNAYSLELGPRVGRTSSKEQYAYYYRHAKVSVTDKYTYADPNDILERPNHNVRFFSPNTNLKDFIFSCTHVRPSDAVAEIDHFTIVNDDIEAHWGVEDILIGGDYNADCSYVRPGDWPYISYRTDSRFNWLIPDDADTTVSSTVCAYDRLTITGRKFNAEYKAGSADVFYFDAYFGISHQLALDVSDHYPVEMTIN
ncbi:deoxyribonuclease-1-like [Ptychodera flava]|uniref:deoxyribonuclease-1-like n=1 Tax=Ptychodera flava TaxID=63121 RepID=UPI00396A0B67